MNPKHDEWIAMEHGAELRREAAASQVLARAGRSVDDRHRRSVRLGIPSALLQAAHAALTAVRRAAHFEPPRTSTR